MTKPKKVPPFRVAFSLDCDNLRDEASREGFLLLMPISRPSKATWCDALEGELRILYGENRLGNEWRATTVQALDAAGRVLWGWATPWRTGANPLTWKVWDSFCQSWLGASCALPSRPKGYDLNALCEEIAALEQAGSLTVLGNYPFSSKQYQAKKNSAAPKSSRQKKGRAATDFDEEPQGELPDPDLPDEDPPGENEALDSDDEEPSALDEAEDEAEEG